MADKLTSKQVVDFANHMFSYYNVTPVLKRKSTLMKIAAWCMDTFGSMDKATFMSKYTVNLFGKIYLAYEIGNAEDKPLELQVANITHECQHTEQRRKNKCFEVKYATSTTRLALWEAEAYLCNMELHFWYTGRILSPIKLSNLLFDYGCSAKEVLMVQNMFERAVPTVKEGLVYSEASKIAITYLARFMSQFKRKGIFMPEKYYEV